jgi:two-component sensor histidine kinase
MARAHEALAATRWHGVELGPMIRATVEPFVGPGSDRLRLSGGRVILKAEAALPVAATLHELATNAVKHGGLSGRPDAGLIDVKWGVAEGGRLTIDWVETGSGAATVESANPGPSQGFGTTLIRGLIAHELKGSTDLDLAPGIVTCRLTVPPASLLRTANPAL